MSNKQINFIGWILFIISALGFIISSILSNRKLEDLDTEVQDLRSQRQLLKEEIFRLSKSRKPQPRKRRTYKPRNTRKKV